MDDEWWITNDEWWMMNDEWWMMKRFMFWHGSLWIRKQWWMKNDGWRMMNHEWWMMDDEWWMMNDEAIYVLTWITLNKEAMTNEDEEWWITNDDSRMKNVEWRMMNDEWWMMKRFMYWHGSLWIRKQWWMKNDESRMMNHEWRITNDEAGRALKSTSNQLSEPQWSGTSPTTKGGELRTEEGRERGFLHT